MMWKGNPNVWVYITVALGILAYCVAEMNLALALVALPIWAMSWPMAQSARGKSLPKMLLVALVLAATVQVGAKVLSAPGELVIAFSRYLVWLHLIKLYEKMTPRDRGQLLTMSVFLALGACLTSNTLWLGLVLLIYTPTLLWTIMIHQLYAGREQVEESRAAFKPATRRAVVDDGALSPRLGRHFKAIFGLAGLVCALVATVVFIITPRHIGAGMNMGGFGDANIGSVTGFNDEVWLGGEGILRESATRVLELEILNERGESAIDELGGSVLLRGMALDEYRDGQWRRSERAASRRDSQNATPDQPIPISQRRGDAPLYTLNITYRNKQSGAIFTLFRPIEITISGYARLTRGLDDQILELDASGRISYTIRSQLDAELPEQQGMRIPSQPAQFRDGRIRELTDRVLADEGLSRDPELEYTEDDERIARAIERYLQSNFMYTIEMTPPRQGEDPIEMFLFRSQVGHCEYFASAMAAMCRSVGIDARVITGYVATEYDDFDEVFIVRESDAHAWIEARVRENHWLTFDPSPPDQLALIMERKSGFLATLRALYEAAENFWVRTIVSYDEDNRAAIMGETPEALQTVSERFNFEQIASSPRRTGVWLLTALGAGAGAFAVTAVMGFGVVRLARAVVAWRRRRAQRRTEEEADPTLAARRRQAAFFDELQRALEKAGFTRPAWRPPLGHVESLREQDGKLADSAADLVHLYYANRYGGRLLSPEELERAETLLDSVRGRLRALDHPGANGRSGGDRGAAIAQR
ncbi:MAG: DUF3488 domain-containing protein [Phycisphaeraceae bacterium]|nr:MAG: DUF3488 domain-containing protein [Phycisphaeraceae bacterium]